MGCVAAVMADTQQNVFTLPAIDVEADALCFL